MAENVIQIPESLNAQSVCELKARVQRASQNDARVMVLRGSAELFCRGLDFEYLLTAGYKEFEPFVQDLVECYLLIRYARKHVIAVVEGEARGAGLGLAAAADLLIAASGAEFGMPEVLFGLDPAVVMPILRERLTPQTARLFALSAHAWTAEEAHRCGLVDRVVPIESIRKETRNSVRRFSLANESAVAMVKAGGERGCDPLRQEIEMAARQTLATMREPHVRERIRRYLVEGVAPWRQGR
jgi:polyketide biosynthesis enoyl-CoA hydratase PksH